MSIVVYPRHYTSRLAEGQGAVASQGDESIELLNNLLLDASTNSRTWPFYRSVLINALRLFGDFREWTQDQLSNPNIVGYNRQFIADTLNFIETGKRELSVQSWYDLVSEGGAGYDAQAIPQRLIENKPLQTSSESSLQLLQNWISKPNGFEDLLTTLHLLFGKAQNS